MDDLISRQALCEYALNQKDKSITPNDIMRLPSAQPETHEERTETHSCDCIERQAAMEEISKQQTYKMFEGEDTLYLDANDVGSVLASLPSAQPERKKGKWIGEERQRLIDETDDGCVYMTDTWWYCSECGNPKGYVGHKPEDKYCNECGAKMEGE